MKHTTALTLTTLLAAAAMAQSAPAGSPFTTAANVALSSDYVFRGVSQTDNSLAISGGYDVSHSSGLSGGVWISNVDLSPASLGIPGASTESDLYLSYGFGLTKDVTASVGYILYYYDNAEVANTSEVNAAVSAYGLTAKLSYTVSDGYFGVLGADGTTYVDLAYSVAVPGVKDLTLGLHYGWTAGEGAQVSYDDYSATLSYPVGGFTASLAYTNVDNAGEAVYGGLAADVVTFSLKKSF
jgi:uncharacterized protein (TIGR02001 family)